MNKTEIGYLRQKLLAQKAELLYLEESARDSTRPVELDQTTVGRLSRMDAIQGQQMALETSRRRLQQLARIENTLLSMDSSDYGDCRICGEEIDPRRLAIDPTNTLCIKCAGNQAI